MAIYRATPVKRFWVAHGIRSKRKNCIIQKKTLNRLTTVKLFYGLHLLVINAV